MIGPAEVNRAHGEPANLGTDEVRVPFGGGLRWPLAGTSRMTSRLASSPEEFTGAHLGQIQSLIATLADTNDHCGKVNPRILFGNTSTGNALSARSLKGVRRR